MARRWTKLWWGLAALALVACEGSDESPGGGAGGAGASSIGGTSAGGTSAGGGTTGGGGQGGTGPIIPEDALYVSPDGDDSGPCSEEQPCETIGEGISRLSPSQTLVVLDGIYSSLDNHVDDVPSGVAGAPTVVMAATPFAARVQSDGASYYENLLKIEGSYIDVSGLVFELNAAGSPPAIGRADGDHLRVMRCGFKRSGSNADEYSSWLSIDGQYNLVEDVVGVGTARYGFPTGGPDAVSHHQLYRRVLGRRDDSAGTAQPQSTFNSYGNNSGTGVHDNAWQNCIAIDGILGQGAGQYAYAWGAWYFPKITLDHIVEGSIAAYNDTELAGMFLGEFSSGGHLVRNVLLMHNTAGVGLTLGGTNGGHVVENLVSIGAATPISGSSTWTETNTQQSGDPLAYVRPVGVSGSVHGELGWDEEQAGSLFPLPYEAEFLALLQEDTAGEAPSMRGWASSELGLEQYIISGP